MAPSPGAAETDPTLAPITAAGIATPNPAQPETVLQVTTFFATDRALDPSASGEGGLKFLAARHEADHSLDSVTLGKVLVSIPPTHQLGVVERPSWLNIFATRDPSVYMLVQSVSALSTEDFFRAIADQAGHDQAHPRSSAFLFVHGFNVSFEDAALTTAQLATDLHLPTVPVFYSWPSQGSVVDYAADESTSRWSQPNFEAFLEEFAQRAAVDDIFVIAHSMGTRITSYALVNVLARHPELADRIKVIVLAAADIDADVFRRDIVPPLQAAHERVTLYVSSRDNALKASTQVNLEPRAGEAGDTMVVIPGIDTVDATAIDDDAIGHSYVFTCPPMLSDLHLLLGQGVPPAARPGLVPVSQGQQIYYQFPP